MNDKFLKPYNPEETEPRIYQKWEESGFFNPDQCIEKGVTAEDAKPFSIILPPPNVTGILHMGHALMLATEDLMIRYKRMRGFKTLWLPGTDHAAIATQSKVEKEISKKEGLSRHDLGREELLKRVGEFAQSSHDTIVSQVKAMGASCDWSREAFTLDTARNKAVNAVFKLMYNDGLIYRKNRVVNWDPKGQTTISDDEIVYEERKAKLYTFKYSADFPIPVATTRLETKLGDTAVAVHPDDPRYKEFVGKTFEVKDFCGVDLCIKIIADKKVEMEFGTGALGVTPAHSMVDAEMAETHGLPSIQVINEYAKMMIGNESIIGKKTTEAREVVAEFLREKGLMIEEKEITQNVSTAERTGGVIEPLPKLQWFIAVNKKIQSRGKSLKELMQEAVSSGDIKIIPEYFGKTYFHWIENLRDWCISRQIWYGHRIPVWYKDGEIVAVGEKTEGLEAEQDPDTLDTWFSSGLWTFSTLGWPEKTEDLKTYHPTSVLETGYDILFFWVARMILMSTYVLGEVPFKEVYLHGMVRDGKGEKMSKSLGNALDPLEISKKYGADAARMALIYGTAPGTDSKISEDKIKGYKHFANKLWNITRFVLENTKDETLIADFESYTEKDLELRSIRHNLLVEITKEMDAYMFHIASEKIYSYVWYEFADKIIEDSKKIFAEGSNEEKKSRKQFLLHTLDKLLKTLHPFMPFVTEEIWGLMGHTSLLMVEKWPIK